MSPLPDPLDRGAIWPPSTCAPDKVPAVAAVVESVRVGFCTAACTVEVFPPVVQREGDPRHPLVRETFGHRQLETLILRVVVGTVLRMRPPPVASTFVASGANTVAVRPLPLGVAITE